MRLTILTLFLLATTTCAFSQWVARSKPSNDLPYFVAAATENVVFSYSSLGLAKSIDAGASWVRQDMVYDNYDPLRPYLFGILPRDIEFTSATTGFILGMNNYFSHEVIFKTDNAGASWSLVHNALGGDLRQMKFPTPSLGFVCGESGRILKTTNGGTTWAAQNSKTTRNLVTIDFLDSNHGLIGGERVILKTMDGGNSWTLIGTPHNIQSITWVDSEIAFATTAEGDLLKTVDAGYHWTEQRVDVLSMYGYVKEVNFVDANSGFLSTSEGLYRTVDGGKLWALQKSIGKGNIYDFDFFNSAAGFVFAQKNNTSATAFFSTSTGGDAMPVNESVPYGIVEHPWDLCRGVYPVSLKVINRGVAPLTNVTFNWSVNDQVQTPFTWNGALASTDTSAAITVGSYDFNKTGRGFVVSVWTSNPNGHPDDYDVNDTTFTTFQFNKFTGQYYVKGADADFENLTTAFSLLNNVGVCGEVVFNLRNGTYEEAHLSLHNIPGASESNRITIQSESGNPQDVMLVDGFNPALSLLGTKHVTVKDITFSGNQHVQPMDILEAEDIVLQHNKFIPAPGVLINALLIIVNSKRISILDNTFEGANTAIELGSALSNMGPHVIDGNTFLNQERIGLNLSCTDVIVSRNKFLAVGKLDAYYGIITQNLSNEKPALFSNNYFHLTASNSATTLSAIATGTGNFKIYHNTAYVRALSDFSSVLTAYKNNLSMDVRNNNFFNDGAGHVITLFEPKNFTSDYNNLFSRGPIGVHDPYGSDRLNGVRIENWRALTGQDIHSIAVDPQMVAEDPHIFLSTSNYALNNTGTPIPEVNTDIDGDARSGSAPDIGADEVALPNIDASLTDLKGRATTVCEGSTPITVQVRNRGTQGINSYSIQWKVDGVDQSVFTSTAALPAQGVNDVTLGAITLSAGVHDVEASLMASGDVITRNDTVTATIRSGGMSGVYTVGGNNPDFATLVDAITALRTAGACSAIIFNIRPGTYEGQVLIDELPGVSENNPLTIQSESKDSTSVTLVHSEVTVRMVSTSYVTLQYLTLATTKLYGAILIDMSGASHNTIKSNVFSAKKIGNAIRLIGMPNEYNTIIHNRFDVTDSEEYETTVVLLQNTSNYERGNIISKNQFMMDNTPVYRVIDINFQEGFSLSGNIFSGPRNSPIRINQSIGDYSISDNRINTKGLVMDISNHYEDRSNHHGLISNNMIQTTDQAIRVVSADHLQIRNNTLVSTGGMTTLWVNGVNVGQYEDIEIKNNILVNTSAPAVIYNAKAKITSDFNVFYSPNRQSMALNFGNIWSPGEVEFFEGLHQWQKRTQGDVSSIFILPQFVSETDLHIKNDARIEGKGTVLNNVVRDIDGELRSTTRPDIGADEFGLTPLPNDIGLSQFVRPDECGSVKPIQVKIKNFGSNAITQATIRWKFNADEKPAYHWTGSLAAGAESVVTLGDATLHPSDTFGIKIWTELPNALSDPEHYNDTLVVTDVYQKLSGNYLIGESIPTQVETDFPTIKSATDYLDRMGVCGPVLFTLREGLYEERVFLQEIEGASETNRITFQGEGVDNTSVIIGGDANWGSAAWGYATWAMSGTKYVTVRQLTFRSTGYPAAVKVFGNTSHNEFLNNRFIGPPNTNWQLNETYFSLFGFGSGLHMSYLFENNYFEGAGYGIGTTDISALQQVTIKSNTFLNQYISGVRLYGYNVDNQIISNSIVCQGFQTYSESAGIKIGLADQGLNIRDNKITGNFSAGIRLENTGSSTAPGWIVNNMISGEPQMGYGIHSWNSNSMRIHFNSVLVTGYAGIYSYQDTSTVITNNNFVNQGTGYASQIEYLGGANSQVDYNNLWSTYGFHKFNSRDFQSLNEYQIASGYDAHSISADPDYFSLTDLHARNTTLQASGTQIAGITTDIDGEVRGIPPDIGADEVVLHDNDAGVYSTELDSCSGTGDVSISLKNFGKNPLLNATIGWSVNGQTQTPFSWTGNVPSGGTTALMKIGSFNFAAGVLHTLKTWATLPNGATDLEHRNDSSKIRDYAPRMKGTYTIGGTNPDFINISSAVQSLANSGICGPVTFNIRDGNYTDYIVMRAINGASARDTIVFQSESRDKTRVNIRHNATETEFNSVWSINEASYITIRDVTLTALGNTNSTVLLVRGPITNVNILNNRLYSTSTPTSSFEQVCLNAGTAPLKNLRVKNCLFQGGSYGLEISGRTSMESKNGYTVIEDNQFMNQSNAGIFAFFLDHASIKRNVVKNTTAQSVNYIGIWLLYGNDLMVSQNKVFTNIGAGLNLNVIDGFLLANNFISVKDSGGPGTAVTLSGVSDGEVFYNSILTLDQTGHAIIVEDNYVSGVSSQRLKIWNNIFASLGGYYAFGFLSNLSEFDLDHNNYYSSGYSIGRINGDSFHDLNEWQDTSPGDLHSINVDPQFVSETDLHAPAVAHVGAGKPTSVTVDIDNEARHLQFPSIGADEFGTISQYDVRVTGWSEESRCDEDEPVSVRVFNVGLETVSSFEVKWSVNGGPQQQTSWTGALTHGAAMNYALPVQDFNDSESYAIDVTISSINNHADEIPGDNALQFNFIRHAQVDLGPDKEICPGDPLPITLNAGEGFVSYLWSDSVSTASRAINETGIYRVSVSDANGCESSDEISIVVLTPATITTDGTFSLCNGNALVLKAAPSGGYPFHYEWRRNNQIIAGRFYDSLRVTEEGEYTVAVGTNYCSSVSTSVNVASAIAPAAPSIMVTGETNICNGDSVELKVANEYANYRWSNGESTRTIYAKRLDHYAVQVADLMLCFSEPSDSVNVLVDFCGPIMITLEGASTLVAPEGESYQWYLDGELLPGEEGRELHPATSGVYTVMVSKNGVAKMSEQFVLTITGVEKTLLERLVVYPNPVKRYAFIQQAGPLREKMEISFHDLTGRVLTLPATWQNDDMVFDLGNVSSGSYYFRVRYHESTATLKVIKIE